ncbi:MAG TPA: uracil-DNA glycosylase family protein [Rubrivivax sp.]|nr:uracil-DNA glycosylase family protein [Rubrivivax sp.]
MSGALRESIDRLVDRHDSDWKPLLEDWRRSPAGRRLIEQVDARLAAGATIYPADMFRALTLTPLAQTRVLILGQDPYHGPAQAEGLAFSVPAGVPVPPSLRNIVTELRRDLGLPAPDGGSLLPWARRGVLLLNTALTVENGLAGSHSQIGWRALTDKWLWCWLPIRGPRSSCCRVPMRSPSCRCWPVLAPGICCCNATTRRRCRRGAGRCLLQAARISAAPGSIWRRLTPRLPSTGAWGCLRTPADPPDLGEQ